MLLTLLPWVASSLAEEPNRSPVDLVLGPREAWLATVNQTADTVSLVRTSDGELLDEVKVLKKLAHSEQNYRSALAQRFAAGGVVIISEKMELFGALYRGGVEIAVRE